LKVYVRDHIHARSKLTITIFSRLKNDLYRNSLNNFYVIAGGIFGRKQTESRARRSRDAVHVAFEFSATRIHMDFCPLPNLHVPKLRLFKIRGYPDFIERHNGEELLPGLNVHADYDCLIYFAAHRSHNLCVLKVELCLLEQRSLLLYIGGRRTSASPG
jgi:hypothetical protein